jgi:hypothetical protein
MTLEIKSYLIYEILILDIYKCKETTSQPGTDNLGLAAYHSDIAG